MSTSSKDSTSDSSLHESLEQKIRDLCPSSEEEISSRLRVPIGGRHRRRLAPLRPCKKSKTSEKKKQPPCQIVSRVDCDCGNDVAHREFWKMRSCDRLIEKLARTEAKVERKKDKAEDRFLEWTERNSH